MTKLSKFVARHVKSFLELKDPKKPRNKKILVVPDLEECTTEAQIAKRLKTIDNNVKRSEENREAAVRYKQELDHIKMMRGVREHDGQYIFGSNFRIGRLSLDETSELEVGGDAEFTGKLVKLLDRTCNGSFKVNGTLDTKPFADLLHPFITDKVVEAVWDISVVGDIKVTPANGQPSQIVDMQYQSDYLFDADLKLGINVNYLKAMLDLAYQLGHETVEMHCKTPMHPLYFTAPGFEYIIAPIRIKQS